MTVPIAGPPPASDDLYHDALLSAARDRRYAEPLVAPDREATDDNPLCGDRVTLQAHMTDGRITALAHQVRGCALCQASAAMLAEAARHGLDRAGLAAAQGAVAALLQSGAALEEPWVGFALFAPVRRARSRWDCVLLPFRTAAALFE